MRCKDAQEMMNAWIDEELFQDKKEAFEDHLVSCRTCSAQAQDLCRYTGLLDAHPPALPAPGLKDKTLSLFMKEAAPKRSNSGWKMQAAMAVSALMGVGIGYYLGAGWVSTQTIGQYGIAGFLFSAGDLLSLWV